MCLILVTLALVSVYGYPNKGAKTSNETDSTKSIGSPRARSGVEEFCTQTSSDKINFIECFDIPENTGDFVANYINANSNEVSTFTIVISLISSYERKYKD
jgi:hypothetical protein